MKIIDYTTPLSPDAPAGLDLDLEEDEAFEAYVYDHAPPRMPSAEGYFTPAYESGSAVSTTHLFDPSTVELDSELERIDALLARSRDLRLFVLRAQWAMLAADIVTCADTIVAIATILETMSEYVHPMSPQSRIEALDGLQADGAILMPLTFLPIDGTSITLRALYVATGQQRPTKQEIELDVELGTLQKMLQHQTEAVENTTATLTRLDEALARIEVAASIRLSQVRTLVSTILSATASGGRALEATNGATQEDGQKSRGGSSYSSIKAPDVVSIADARRRLESVETYLVRTQPSSGILALVVQARELIGRSLMEIFEELMPDATRATMTFEKGTNFKLGGRKLDALSRRALQPDVADDGALLDDDAAYQINSVAQACGHLEAVERHFQQTEVSSPIPMLLARARNFAGKDFDQLVAEFFQ